MKYLLILCIAMPAFSELDLTIPEQPAIKLERTTFLNLTYYREPPTKAQVITFWTLTALDTYTTHQALKQQGVYERNPVLGKNPSLGQLIVFKAATGHLATTKLDKRHIQLANVLLAGVSYNNYQLSK